MKIIGVEGLTNEQVQAEVGRGGRDVTQEVMAQVAAPASGAMPMPQT
jgi:hypothetical protein